jgi:Male sterility protein
MELGECERLSILLFLPHSPLLHVCCLPAPLVFYKVWLFILQRVHIFNCGFLDIDIKVPFAEVPINDPHVPLGQGYAESKWVSEKILDIASKHTSLRPVVVRIGQITGGINGSWNPSEWMGAMVKSSVALGCFPEWKGVSSLFLSGFITSEYSSF